MLNAHEPDPADAPTDDDDDVEREIAEECDRIIQQVRQEAALTSPPAKQ